MSRAPSHLQLVAPATPAPAPPLREPPELEPLPPLDDNSSWIHVLAVAVDLMADAARAYDLRREAQSTE